MNAIELNEFATKVAGLLGLQAYNCDDRIRIFTGAESYFTFRLIDRDARLEVNGNFHLESTQADGSQRSEWHGPSSAHSPTITIAAKSTPEQAAAQIKRRFLTSYAETFAVALSIRNANDAYRSGSVALKADIQAALGTSCAYPISFSTHGNSASVVISCLNREQAIALANYLRTSGISLAN